MPKAHLAYFTPQELELLICGLQEVDIDDLAAHTQYSGGGYNKGDAVIGYFWAALRSFTAEERTLFVQFVTGSRRVPLGGFAALQGSTNGAAGGGNNNHNGSTIQHFNIHKAYNTNLLPTAHTCFNQLDLPQYSSLEVMKHKLLLAIKECNQGFGFV